MDAFVTIRKTLFASASLLLAVSLPWQANAATVGFTFFGPGVSGTIQVTYGLATDGKYPQAFEVTGISGTFSDSNNGLNIVNAAVGPLEAINHSLPEPANTLAPADFSKFAVASGLPADNNGFLTYDNLYWPGGSMPTAFDYQVHGGILDIYGLLFDIGGGRVVDLWSNGDFEWDWHRSRRLRCRGRNSHYGAGLCRRWRDGNSRAFRAGADGQRVARDVSLAEAHISSE